MKPADQPRNPVPYYFKLHVHKWAQRHRLSCAMAEMGQMLALSAGWAFELMQMFRLRQVDPLLPARPPIADWLGLYRDHRAVLSAGGDLLPEWGGGKSLMLTGDCFRAVVRYAKQDPDGFKACLESEGKERFDRRVRVGWKLARRDYRSHLMAVHREISGNDPEDGADLERAVMRQPAVYFFVKVFLPCVVMYAKMPGELLRAARLGDNAAVEDLIRLDDAAMYEPRIVAWKEQVPGATRLQRSDDIASWMKGGIAVRLTPTSIKQSFAGLMSLLSEHLNLEIRDGAIRPRRLTVTQIREAFDAAHRDRYTGKGPAGPDPDLALVDDDALKKAIQRSRKVWGSMFGHRGDKSPVSQCPR